MNEPDPRPSPAAERMRLHRERRRNGMRSLWIELRVTEIDALITIGLLKGETRNDPNGIRKALYGYLDQTLGRPASGGTGQPSRHAQRHGDQAPRSEAAVE